MLSHEEIHQLLRLKADFPAVASLYLRLNEEKSLFRQCQDLAHQAVARNPLLNEFRRDFERFEDFVSGFKPEHHRGLALFSSQRSNYWQAVPLPLPVKNDLRIGTSPCLAPFTNIVEQYRRYGIALLGPDKNRFCEAYLGQIQECPEPSPQTPSGPPAGLRDSFQFRLKILADQLMALSRLRGWDQLIVAAPPDWEGPLAGHLNSQLQEKLIQEPRMHPGMSSQEILKVLIKREAESREVRESVMVHRLFDVVKAAGMGVAGLEPTLKALMHGQVRLLIVREGLAKIGRKCRRCRALVLSGRKCPYCWSDTEPLFNMVAEMVELALERNCEVFQVLNKTMLDAFGGIGAELRFKDDSRAASEPGRPQVGIPSSNP
ncbi:MAG: hypothetical protein HY921_03625 [Elusimicrobia bacterium]|nr:hypothetical protein [Elusimicrobiota bacterium]